MTDFMELKKGTLKLCVLAHASNPSIQEAEAKEFETNLDYICKM